jgi:hypothetical protein
MDVWSIIQLHAHPRPNLLGNPWRVRRAEALKMAERER